MGQPEQDQKSSKGRRRKKRGYIHRSPAVSVTVYDLSGRALPEKDVDEIVEQIFAVAYNKGYVINIART